MFRKLHFIVLIFTCSSTLLAQSPTKGINYQAVIVDPKQIDVPGVAITGQPLASGNVCVRFSILNGQTLEYEETQQTKTDEYGLINLTIGAGQVTTNSKAKAFDVLKWSSKTFALSVSVSFDNCVNFKVVSTQLFNYTPYALYAESVEYVNVRNAPSKLSDFSNDVGYITKSALGPLEDSLAKLKQENQKQFTLINQDISLVKTDVSDLNAKVTNLNTQFDTKLAGVSANLSSQISTTNTRIDQLGTTYEVLSNKSTATNLGGASPSDNLYPSQKAVKSYVDVTVQDAIASGAPDATTLAKGKVKLAGDLSGTADNPTVPGLLNKEDLANKTNDITGNASSQTKYPSVKAIKEYVDASVTGLAFQANLDLKADKNSPTFTGTPVLPGTTVGVTQAANDNSTALATTAFVQNALSAGVIDATNQVKGKIKLAGDLSGTADSPTVPGLTFKEELSNKSDDANLGTSVQLYPTQRAVKTYVDNSIVNAAVPDASTTSKGKIQLGGDLAGTGTSANAPIITDEAITTNKLANSAVTSAKLADGSITSAKIVNLSVNDAKIAAVSGTKVLGDISGKAQNVNGIVDPVNGGTGVGGTLTGYIKGNGTSAMTSSLTIPVSDVTDAQSVANLSTAIDLGNTAASNTLYPSQLAVKTYVDSRSNASIGSTTQSALNAKEDVANKDPNVNLGNSNTLYPTQNAVKTYVDSKLGGTNAIGSLGGLPNLNDQTVLGNTTGAITTPQELPITGTGHVVFSNNPNITSANLTNPKLNGTITGTAVVPIVNGGTGTTSLPSGYVKGGSSSLSTVAVIPWQDVTGAVHSVNGNLADPATGNVSIAFGKVTTGLLISRPDVSVTNNGDIYVVSGETGADAGSNGRTFISTGGATGTWNEVTTNQASLDARYVQLAGSTMIGNLVFPTGTKITMQDAPVNNADLANKSYVDAAVVSATPDATNLATGKIQLSGDLTGTATSPIIKDKAISFAKMQEVASNTILGRASAGSGSLEALSTLPVATLPAFTGDVVTSAGSATTTIQDHAVTFAKIQSLSGQSLLLGTGSTGGTSVSEISLGTGLSMNNGVLSANGGTVTNVTGTSNRIDVSNGTATPTIDISPNYVGQASINTLGTITTGSWNASKINVANGGTGATTFSAGYLKANGTNPFITVAAIPVADVSDAETSVNKSSAVDLDGNAANHTKYPTQLAVKTYVDGAILAAATPDASTSVLGKIQLGGDLAGTGSSASAPIISNNAITSSKLAPSSVLNAAIGETITVTNGGTGVSTLSGYVKGNGTSAMTASATIPVADVTGAQSTANLSGDMTIDAGSTSKYPSVSAVESYVRSQATPSASTTVEGKVKLSQDLGGTAALPKVTGLQGISISTTAPASNQVLKYNGTEWVPSTDLGLLSETQSLSISGATITLSGTNSTVTMPDATTLSLGLVKLAGDLGGTADSPTVPGLALKAPLASPSLTGVPTAPTANAGTNSTQIATTAFVTDAITTAATPDATTSSKGKVQLAGDLGGTADSPSVVKIQGVAVSTTAPATNQFLKYNGTNWVPTSLQLETEEFTASGGQTDFILTNAPQGKVAFFRNGARLPKASISIAGTTIPYIPANNNAEILVAGDRITIDYLY